MRLHYDERYKDYEDTVPAVATFSTMDDLEKSTNYLKECNWFAEVYNKAYGKGRELKGDMETDQWYAAKKR